MLSCSADSVTPWTVACQAPRFNPRIESESPASPVQHVDSLPLSPLGSQGIRHSFNKRDKVSLCRPGWTAVSGYSQAPSHYLSGQEF